MKLHIVILYVIVILLTGLHFIDKPKSDTVLLEYHQSFINVTRDIEVGDVFMCLEYNGASGYNELGYTAKIIDIPNAIRDYYVIEVDKVVDIIIKSGAVSILFIGD